METSQIVEPSRAQAPAQAADAAAGQPGAAGNESQQQPVMLDPDKVADAIEASGATQATIREILASHPSVRALTVSSAVRCLRSERMMFDRETKKIVTVGDGATIMKAVVFLAAYGDGLPVQQTVNVNFDANKEMPVKEMLVKSPALRAAFRRQLEEAEREAGDVHKTGGAKPALPPSGERPAA